MSEKPIPICLGTHGGINNLCATCLYYLRFRDDYKGSAHEPPGKYVFINIDICTLVKPYWSLYKSGVSHH